MKTYKLFSLKLIESEKDAVVQKDIPLIDGIIMDMDDNGKRWLVDIVISSASKLLFADKKTVLLELVITGPNNHPVIMAAKLEHIHSFTEHYGVLFEGSFIVHRDALIEVILQGLVKEGYSGQAFIDEYKKRRANDGEGHQRVIEQIYQRLQEHKY